MKQFLKYNVIKLVLLVSVFLLTSISNSFGQSKAEKIKELMSVNNEYGLFNGSVLVVENGKVIYNEGVGFANMEWDIPNKPNTKHRLGSITKQFTSMLILQLVEQGKLKLDAKISNYLPDYPKKTGNQITVHHLLTHTSGIPEFLMIPNFMKEYSRNTYTPNEFISLFSDLPLQFKPGKKFSYSNSGYFLLGVLIEKITGKSYEQVLHENIFIPLKMKNTGFDHHSTLLKNRATGYLKTGKIYSNSNFGDMSIPYAAGSMYSTTEDLFIWDKALSQNLLLKEKYKKLLFKPYVSAWGGGYGYGWHIIEKSIGGKKVKIINHTGGINGFTTVIYRMPEQNNLIVLLNNVENTNLTNIGLSIGSILYNGPYVLPKKSFADLLMETAMTEGFDIAFRKFVKFKDTDNYSINENEINNLGYQLLGMNKVVEAIEILKLNVEKFPNSWNTYDSLGEAYLINGSKKMAILNYKKSLKLNPKNLAGKKALKKLQN
ncbi:serine hydrolase [Polaribacter ponticola]|uniref:Serine hydrolase n=1 Tax=Polaribacter ponticola TaxID=2978475 RepID=A0ABT5S9L9_9FLAO|nr:serine hydrolase [Polaribacter sp. MSW5]MDD7914795.1 serine hydrolase [Polaribacter sp. MSW5]